MKNRLFAYHHLILPDGSRVDMAVVEVDEESHYVSHHALQGGIDGSAASFVEEPFVEWIGGTYEVKREK